jgi:hypothetical protein
MNTFTGAGTEPKGYPFRIDGRLVEPVSRWLWLGVRLRALAGTATEVGATLTRNLATTIRQGGPC